MKIKKISGMSLLSQVFILLIPLFFFTSCSKERCHSVPLVQEADVIITSSGLENPNQRQKATDLYNRALACGETLPDAENAFVQSHANFGLAMINAFDAMSLVDTMVSSVSEGTSCGTSGISCGGGGGSGCPDFLGTGGMSCSGSSGSCSIGKLRSLKDINKHRSQLVFAGFLNGIIYFSPFLFLLGFRVLRALRKRRADFPTMFVIMVFFSSLMLTGLGQKQNENGCQPVDLGDLPKFLDDAADQILTPIINELTEVAKYKEFSINIQSAKLNIFSDSPFTPNVADDPLYIDLKGNYDYGDVVLLLGTFQGLTGLSKIIFAYDIIEPLLAYITAPDCTPNPLTVPGFGEAVATVSEVANIRAFLASSLGSFAGAFNYIISERVSQNAHLFGYTDSGIDARSDANELNYDAANSKPDPDGDNAVTEKNRIRESEEAAIQMVKLPANYPVPPGISKHPKIFTSFTSAPVEILGYDVLPVGETFYDYGRDGKAHALDRDKTYAANNVDGSGDNSGGLTCSTSNWCNPYVGTCVPVCSTEKNGIYENAATCAAITGKTQPGETFVDTNGNSIYDSGEPFRDVGCDGIAGKPPDFGEGDGVWIVSLPGEPFDDFGIDGIPGTFDYGEGDSYFQPFAIGTDTAAPALGGTIVVGVFPTYIIKQGINYYDSDGILHIAGTRNWADVGIDGVPDQLEVSNNKGYEAVCKNDPNGDNYNASSNPGGTEGNDAYDAGEPFLDWGNDTVTVNGYVIGVPDISENGFKSADPSGDNYNETANPRGTENNIKYDPGERWDLSITGHVLYIVLQALHSFGIDLSSVIAIDVTQTGIEEAAPLISNMVAPVLSKIIYLDEISRFLTSVQKSIMDDTGSLPGDIVPLIQSTLRKVPNTLTELSAMGIDPSFVKQYSALLGFAATMPPMMLYNLYIESPEEYGTIELLNALFTELGLPPIPSIPAIDLGALFSHPPTNITSILPMFHKTDEPCSGDCASIEPFADINGNGIRDPFEYFVDTNGNGVYNSSTATFTDIDGNATWNKGGEFMTQTTEIERWWDVGDPAMTGDPAEGNGKFDRGEPFYDWGVDKLHDLYEISPWGPDGRPGVAQQDDNGINGVDDTTEYLFGYTSGNGSGSNDDRLPIPSELGPDGMPGVAGVDDDGNTVVDDFSEYLWPLSDDTMLAFGPDGKPGVSGVDDDGTAGIDNAGEYIFCLDNPCAGNDDIMPPFGPDGMPGVAGVDDDIDGQWDNLSEYSYCQNFSCPGSDDNKDPAGDNYNYYTNFSGTERNGVYDLGEKYDDYGIDGKVNTNDAGENNGAYDAGDPFSNVGIDHRHDEIEPSYDAVFNPDPDFDNMNCLPNLCPLIYTATTDSRTERSLLQSPKFDPASMTSLIVADDIYPYTFSPVREVTASVDPKWETNPGDPRYKMIDFPHYWPYTGRRDDINEIPDPAYLFFPDPTLNSLLTMPKYHNGGVSYFLLSPNFFEVKPERSFECGSITYNVNKMNNVTLNMLSSLVLDLMSGERVLSK